MAKDVVVVGAGISGLVVAALLAKQGREVCVLERASEPGGRGRSPKLGEVPLNLGAHALYRGGASERVLSSLGVSLQGFAPPQGQLVMTEGHTVHKAPTTVGRAFDSTWMPWSSKAGFLGALLRAGKEAQRLDPGVSVGAWLEQQHDPTLRSVLGAFLRIATYSNAPARLSAGPAMKQISTAAWPGVRYLDGGWEGLVSRLVELNRHLGVELRCGVRVEQVKDEGRTLVTSDGVMEAEATVLACALPVAASVSGLPALRALESRAVGQRAATLDLVLDDLPRWHVRPAIALDAPMFFVVASHPSERPVRAHVLYTLGQGEVGAAVRPQVEAWLDDLQPGWRARVLAQRFLPELQVADALPVIDEPARPGAQLGAKLFAAAEWAERGFLLDASLACAEKVAVLMTRPQAAAA